MRPSANSIIACVTESIVLTVRHESSEEVLMVRLVSFVVAADPEWVFAIVIAAAECMVEKTHEDGASD
jgi:hypothetical protein